MPALSHPLRSLVYKTRWPFSHPGPRALSSEASAPESAASSAGALCLSWLMLRRALLSQQSAAGYEKSKRASSSACPSLTVLLPALLPAALRCIFDQLCFRPCAGLEASSTFCFATAATHSDFCFSLLSHCRPSCCGCATSKYERPQRDEHQMHGLLQLTAMWFAFLAQKITAEPETHLRTCGFLCCVALVT
jgi:hypothetical protein